MVFPSNLDSICASSSLAFSMAYAVFKLNKQADNIDNIDKYVNSLDIFLS